MLNYILIHLIILYSNLDFVNFYVYNTDTVFFFLNDKKHSN